jgi:Fe-S cluster assembly iron-binding protein IscA
MTEKSLNLLEIDDIDDAPVSFTPEAVNAVKDALFAEESEPEVGLRVGVRGGGCAGYSYVLDFTKVKENDLVMNFNDFTGLYGSNLSHTP